MQLSYVGIHSTRVAAQIAAFIEKLEQLIQALDRAIPADEFDTMTNDDAQAVVETVACARSEGCAFILSAPLRAACSRGEVTLVVTFPLAHNARASAHSGCFSLLEVSMKFLAACAFAALIAPEAMAESPFEGEMLAATQPRSPAQPTDDACRFSIAYESETVKVWVCLVPGRREDDKG